MEIVDGLITKKNPDGTGLIIVNGLLVFWDEAVVGWTGKIDGVTNPAKINGVAVADIASVMGVS